MDEPIRSHLPNENYRRGWDEIDWSDKGDHGEPIEESDFKVQDVDKAMVVNNFMHNRGWDETFGKPRAEPGWDEDTWCCECKCSHFPADCHVLDHG